MGLLYNAGNGKLTTPQGCWPGSLATLVVHWFSDLPSLLFHLVCSPLGLDRIVEKVRKAMPLFTGTTECGHLPAPCGSSPSIAKCLRYKHPPAHFRGVLNSFLKLLPAAITSYTFLL